MRREVLLATRGLVPLQIPRLRGAREINPRREKLYEGWNFNSGNYLFTTDTK